MVNKRGVIVLISLMFLLTACDIFRPVQYSYHVIWNGDSKAFERAPVQLGFLTPDFYVEEYKKSGDSVFIIAETNFFQNSRFNSPNKFLIECNKNGYVLDTVLLFTDEDKVLFKYKRRKNSFFVLIQEGEVRGAYLTDKIFQVQGRAK